MKRKNKIVSEEAIRIKTEGVHGWNCRHDFGLVDVRLSDGRIAKDVCKNCGSAR